MEVLVILTNSKPAGFLPLVLCRAGPGRMHALLGLPRLGQQRGLGAYAFDY